MVLSASPRKAVPLASGDGCEPSKVASITRRAFFCGVVVESEGGNAISEDVQELVASLGDPLSSQPDNDTVQSSSLERDGDDDANVEINRNMKSSSSAIEDILNEFVATERSYVKRLRTLKHDYADPLRTFARSKDTAIISLYDANTLFGNIDNLLPVNEALLADLDKMVSPEGPQTVGFIGDVVLRHFKDFHGFEQYKQYYVKREEAQSIFEREMSRKSSGFAAFVDRIKYSSADTMNRIGLRELLMDPVQRIPRYTMMLHAMIKRMPSGDPQRAKLVEAVEIASKIAQAEVDEETRRASVMFCLRTTIDGFPPGLISHSRRLVDYIDVGDAFTEGLPSAPSGTGNSVLEPLHCTLFLFDDKLMIAKRPGNGEKSGQVLTGLDQLEKIAKGSGVPSGLKKSGMSCKGVVDLTDVVATDVGGADFHLYLEKPPQDQTDRWSGRPFRPLSVVFPPYPPNLNPQRTENEKVRFLENLWLSQANIRARSGKSIVLHSDEREVESRGGRTTYARTYFNVYQRTAFLQEPRKTKVVVHIDELGTSDPIPFGVNGPPFVSIRVQPMAGALSRYKVTSSDPNDENEEDIVQTGRVSDRVVHTIHQYGLFKFRTGKNSVPSTPTATSRSRATIFGLDAISRNLFNAFPVTVRGDIFGGSINGSRRSKSSTSRSSVSAQSSSDGSFTRFSQRSSSTLTAATSISSMDDETLDGTRPSRQKSRTRRLLGRSRSPKGSGSEPDVSPKRRTSRSGSVSSSFSREQSPAIDQVYDAHEMAPEKRDMDESEWDLTMRLELARHNSQNQRSKGPTEPPWDGPVEDTIYEDKISVPESLRPSSPASRSVFSQRSTTPTNLLFLPSPTEVNEPPESAARKVSGSRPRGPRSPSPLPPSPRASPEPDFESLDSALETTLHNLNPPPVTPPKSVSPLPRSRRQPFEPTGNTEATPISISHSVQNTPTTIEPLSIKKKISLRSSTGESPPNRKAQTRTPPNIRGRIVSPRRVSPIVRQKKTAAFSGSRQDIGLPRLLRLVESIKTELETSRRAVKRIKLDSEQLPWTQISDVDDHVPRLHKIGGLHPTPQRNSVAMNKAAQERMDEMRQLIRKRVGEVTPRSQCRGQKEVVSADSDMCRTGDLLISIEDALSEADKSLVRAASNQEALSVDIGLLATDLKEKASLIEKSRVELQSTKRQCELVKSLLADATAENEIMYEVRKTAPKAFNEELDGMFNDAHLPETDAWAAMTRDLRQSKESRNALSKENSQLKRRLAESESEKEEWGALLRRHGLIS
ncbi:hypothetical protein BJV74DRAFT_315564 [Russula compacta]|nr:hypothetical protein BJV74DRAFT_315564 [Russula compacta]